MRECLAIRVKVMPDDWRRYNAASLLGAALMARGRYAEAEPLVVSGYEGMKAREAKIPTSGEVQPRPRLAERVVQLYRDSGQAREGRRMGRQAGTGSICRRTSSRSDVQDLPRRSPGPTIDPPAIFRSGRDLLMNDVTQILEAVEQGDAHAAARLLPLLYDELRKLAAQKMALERPGQTLQATALVHEAYFRLVGDEPGRPWQGRGHFFAAAAEAMSRILVENARQKGREKHGGGRNRVDLEPDLIAAPEPDDDVLALNAALEKLAQIDPIKARLVELRYFAGLTSDRAAEILGISPSTADRHWTYARAWLRREVRGVMNPKN